MAITGNLVAASARFTAAGVHLEFSVELYDSTLGYIGQKGFIVNDPALTSGVLGYVMQQLPSVTQQVGVPISVQVPAPPPPLGGGVA